MMCVYPSYYPCAVSEAEEARARLAETEDKLDASEAYCRDVEGKLAFLVKKSEHTLGEQRLKVRHTVGVSL